MSETPRLTVVYIQIHTLHAIFFCFDHGKEKHILDWLAARWPAVPSFSLDLVLFMHFFWYWFAGGLCSRREWFSLAGFHAFAFGRVFVVYAKRIMIFIRLPKSLIFTVNEQKIEL